MNNSEVHELLWIHINLFDHEFLWIRIDLFDHEFWLFMKFL